MQELGHSASPKALFAPSEQRDRSTVVHRVEVGVSRTAWVATPISESAIVISSALRTATHCDIVERDLFDLRLATSSSTL